MFPRFGAMHYFSGSKWRPSTTGATFTVQLRACLHGASDVERACSSDARRGGGSVGSEPGVAHPDDTAGQGRGRDLWRAQAAEVLHRVVQAVTWNVSC